jgi:hypothetical protein
MNSKKEGSIEGIQRIVTDGVKANGTKGCDRDAVIVVKI